MSSAALPVVCRGVHCLNNLEVTVMFLRVVMCLCVLWVCIGSV